MIASTPLTSDQVQAELAKLPGILSGRLPDRYGIGAAFALRFAAGAFSTFTREFIVKARGGTDGAGIKWKPLDPKYVAYGRRPGKSHPTTPDKRPSSALTAAHRKLWWTHYRQSLAWLAASLPLAEAKPRAAAIAWARTKAAGGQTKVDKWGHVAVEILRDTGILINSLSPKIHDSFSPANKINSTKDAQILRYVPGELTIGTNVPYASAHHGRDGEGPRPLWPKPNDIPQAWYDQWTREAAKGLEKLVQVLAKGKSL